MSALLRFDDIPKSGEPGARLTRASMGNHIAVAAF